MVRAKRYSAEGEGARASASCSGLRGIPDHDRRGERDDGADIHGPVSWSKRCCKYTGFSGRQSRETASRNAGADKVLDLSLLRSTQATPVHFSSFAVLSDTISAIGTTLIHAGRVPAATSDASASLPSPSVATASKCSSSNSTSLNSQRTRLRPSTKHWIRGGSP